MRHVGTPPVVMAGLDPAIYAFATHRIGAADGVDHRVTPGDDDFQERRSAASQPISLNRTAVRSSPGMTVEWWR